MDFRDIVEFFRDAFKYIMVAVVVFLLFIFVIGLQQVVGPSMTPTLKEGSVVIVNKLQKNPKRENVIVLHHAEKYMIKRVIGLPGDTVECKDNVLYINGKKYDETYLPDGMVNEDFSTKDMGYEVIPDDMYLVLGDNRVDSQDSRDYGLISKKDIIGRVMLSIWPLDNIKFF